MKKIRKILALALVLAVVFALCSCGAVETERGNEIKAKCEAMVDALIANDENAAYAIFTKELDRNAFAKSFLTLRAYIEGVETYELKQVGWYTGIDNGASYYRATFAMTTNAGNFTIEAMEVDGYDGLYNFRIINNGEYENYTGTITKMNGASPTQWGLIIFSALCLGFVVWMLIDCIKRKMKFKVLWVLLILFGAVTFTVTVNNTGVNFNTNIAAMLFTYSYLKVYAAGASILNLAFPIGAVIYCIFRKKFTLAPVQYAEEAAEAPAAEESAEAPAAEAPVETTEENENNE